MLERDEDSQAGVKSRRLEVNGFRAHYLEAGSGPPVVLVHGGASDSRDWAGVMAALSHRHRLYAPDLIGFGRSERREEGYYLTDFSEFIVAFIKSLALEKAILVGHSFGGRICLEVAVRHPERVRKLVLVDATGFGRVSRLGHLILTAFWVIRRLLRLRQPFPRFLSRKGEEQEWETAPGVADVRAPTLIIWKRHDPYLPLALARRAQTLIPGANLTVLPGYGHAPHGQHPAVFSRLLLDFCNGD